MEIFYTRFERKDHYKKFSHYLETLSSSVKEEIFRYKVSHDIVSRLLGKLLLKEGIQKYLGEDQVLDSLRYNKYGKPFIPHSDVNFSLSHSGSYVVLAMGHKIKLGIDIEKIEELQIAEFKNAFAEKEWETILNSPCPLEQFFIYWTKKESAAKADGRGLSIPLNDILIHNSISEIYNKRWFLTRIDLNPDYVVHVASEFQDSVVLTKVDFMNSELIHK